jgi:tetraacyldisaccharide 4'-kinase
MSRGALARRVERLWYGDSPLVLPLLPLSWLFAGLVSLRRSLYAGGTLRATRVGVPVIVVGNLTVGGTGKTPLVAWLVNRLASAGFRPGIVSRGYGGGARREPLRLGPASRVEEVGDEPLLLARATGAPVAVCADRPSAARLLVADGVDVIVADDGLQHYALARDLEIVVLDGERRLGNGRMLPAGPLREPPGRLREAALVLVNGGRAAGTDELSFELRATGAVALGGGARLGLGAFAGRKVWAVAGIGNPERFLAELRRHGIEPLAVEVPDHGRTDLALLRARADWPILMTEKDAVKYLPGADEDVWYLPAEVVMSAEVERVVLTRVLAALAGGSRGGH